MPWVRLDDGFPDHPKVVQAGPRAGWLYVCGLAYSARHLTDGFIPMAALPKMVLSAAALASRLAEVHLWEKVEGGYKIHDYLHYNPTRQATLALRKQKADAGRRGGYQKAGTLPDLCQDSAKHSASVLVEKISAPVPVPIPIPSSKASSISEHHQEIQTAGEAHTTPGVRALAARQPSELEFDEWWQVYPRHEGKHAARQSYEKRRKAGRSHSALMAAVQFFRDRSEEDGAEIEFIAHASTWLNQLRDEEWENGPPVPPRSAGRSKSNGREEPRGFAGIREAFADLASTQ